MGPGLVVALALGALCTIALRPLLRSLPEPLDAADKTAYRDLGTTRFLIGTSLVVVLAAGVAALTLPTAVLPAWWVLSSAGVVLTAVDARTTWLPLRLTRWAWLVMGVAVVATGFSAGWSTSVRTALGAGAAGALYLGVWRVSRGGFGFGDVRFAPLIGAATAAGSWTLLLWGLALGTFVGGAQGVVRLARRRRDGFPYAPAMLSGAYLACVLLALTG